MSIWSLRIEVLAVPAVRKMNRSVEARVGSTILDACREATVCSLVPANVASVVAYPLRDILSLYVRWCLAEKRVASEHAEAAWEFKRISLGVLAVAGVLVVQLVAVGRHADVTRTVLRFHEQRRMPVQTVVVSVSMIAGITNGRAVRLLK